MVKKTKGVGTRSMTDKKSASTGDMLRDLFEAVCILESVISLLKHYHNDLGDEPETAWYGLSLVLGDVLETVVDAKEMVEYGSLGKNDD